MLDDLLPLLVQPGGLLLLLLGSYVRLLLLMLRPQLVRQLRILLRIVREMLVPAVLSAELLRLLALLLLLRHQSLLEQELVVLGLLLRLLRLLEVGVVLDDWTT